MSTNTSIGPDPARGGNEDHGNADGCGNKTLGEHPAQQQPAGAVLPQEPAHGTGKQPQQER